MLGPTDTVTCRLNDIRPIDFWSNDPAGNTKGGSITVPLTSCLTGLESAV